MSRGSRGGSIPADIHLARIVILLCVFALMLIGFVMVYSTTSVERINDGGNPVADLMSQVAFAAIGVVVLVVLWKALPHRVWLTRFIWVVWGIAAVLLVLTWGMGTELHGAKRWLQLGPVGMQPSEFVKIALLLMAVRIMYLYRSGEIEFRAVVAQTVLFVLLPLGFMYKTQSDLGTTLVCIVGILAVMWAGGVSWRFMLIVLGVVFALGLIAIFGVGYRADRLVYLDPWNDGEDGYGVGYNIIRSYYAIAEGGLFGVGIGGSHEKFQYLFASESDFIFAVVCEELGMVGALLVIALFLAILVAGLRISSTASDGLGSMIAASCTIMLVAQAFLNIGVAIGVLPTTGKPLPFISSGGSSLVSSMILIGLVLSVSNAAAEPSVYEKRRADLRIVRAERPRFDQDHAAGREKLRPSARGRSDERAGGSSRRGRADAPSRSSRTSRRLDSGEFARLEMPHRSRR